MLSSFPAMTTIPVADMARARAFYDDLGFKATREGVEGVTYQAGDTMFLLFETPMAGTNKATAMAFGVSPTGFDGEVADLRSHGVQFMTFEAPTGTWDNGVLNDGDMHTAWFEDPDHNVLCIATMPE
jgi:catechol 2,3-dioxygenase-like lactoylglutathione lyase family enzyme